MFIDTTWRRPAQETTWPASYRGVGLAIERLADGWYIGMAEGGYRSRPYPDSQAALADVTAWIDSQVVMR